MGERRGILRPCGQLGRRRRRRRRRHARAGEVRRRSDLSGWLVLRGRYTVCKWQTCRGHRRQRRACCPCWPCRHRTSCGQYTSRCDGGCDMNCRIDGRNRGRSWGTILRHLLRVSWCCVDGGRGRPRGWPGFRPACRRRLARAGCLGADSLRALLARGCRRANPSLPAPRQERCSYPQSFPGGRLAASLRRTPSASSRCGSGCKLSHSTRCNHGNSRRFEEPVPRTFRRELFDSFERRERRRPNLTPRLPLGRLSSLPVCHLFRGCGRRTRHPGSPRSSVAAVKAGSATA